MNIIINGTSQQINSANHLSDLVVSLCKNPKHVITELNGTIVPPEQWSHTFLKEGDSLELVTFVGGG